MHAFARALAWYLAGGFAVALLCAIPYFDPDSRARRPLLLAAIGPLHPIIALTALGIARDDEGPLLLPSASVVVSIGAALTLLLATA